MLVRDDPAVPVIFGIGLQQDRDCSFSALRSSVFNSAYGVINARKQRVTAVRAMGASRRWRVFRDV